MSAEERMLEAILAYLSRRLGSRATLRGVRLDVTGVDGLKQEIRLKPGCVGIAPEEEETGATPIRRAVLEVLADAESPLKGQTIARRAGRAYSGTFRTALAAMVREGTLLLVEDGYTLAEQDGQDSQS